MKQLEKIKEIKDFSSLDNQTLSKAFHVLLGSNYKKDWNEATKSSEIRAIFTGATEVCVPFKNWIKLIEFFNQIKLSNHEPQS